MAEKGDREREPGYRLYRARPRILRLLPATAELARRLRKRRAEERKEREAAAEESPQRTRVPRRTAPEPAGSERGSERASRRSREEAEQPAVYEKPRRKRRFRRRLLRWLLRWATIWALLSLALFAISSQIQKGKLDDAAKLQLDGGIDMLTSKETILFLGSDARPEDSKEPGAHQGPSRADTIMLLRAGAGAFAKLSIPRDAFAEIPGYGPQKINAAYALGGPALQVQTVERFLGINIDHLVEVNFEGFVDFIDALGGVEVELKRCVVSNINGGRSNGGYTLRLQRGVQTLSGHQALALARTRKNECNSRTFGESDLSRAERQQKILSGIKGRLTDPLRLPYNFIRGPWIGWTAPRAVVADMGGLTMSELVLAAMIGGDSEPKVLQPVGPGPAGSLIISDAERQAAVQAFLDG